MLKRALLVVVFCSFAFSMCPLLHGQATGSLSGTVSDKAGAVLSGATVKATSQATGLFREAKTDDSGHYLIPLLPVSNYTIRVESQGFRTTEQKDIRLQVDEHREIDFGLAPASVSTTVEVNATEVAVETSNPSLGQVITSEQVAELPLNGRDFVQLATLTPGTTQETNPGSFFNGGPSSEVSARGTYSLSVGGSRAQSTDWLLDGNDNNELTGGGISILPSIDAIQEFKVLTYNYSAEYGTRSGPTVLVTTKSGGNNFHGSLFEFFRNTKLDARSYFASSREQFNLNQFGGALGGAIKKDKTFFFIDYQAKMQRHGIPSLGVVPTPAMMTGDFSTLPTGGPRSTVIGQGALVNPFASTPLGLVGFYCDGAGNPVPSAAGIQTPTAAPCNKIPADMIDPVGQRMINLYPTANVINSPAGNYADVPVRKLNEGEFDVRLDHSFSNKDSVFARFSYDQATSFVPGGTPGFAEANAFASTQNITNHGRNVAISETHIVNDRNVNQFNAGFNRIFNHILSFGNGTCEAALLGINGGDLNSKCPGAPAGVITQSTKDCMSCGLSSTQLSGYYALGDRGFAPFQGGTNVYSVSDTFDMIRSKHNIRVGGGFRDMQMNVETNAFQDGFFLLFSGFTGDSAADLLLGQIGGAIHDQTFNGATTGRRWKLFRPFVQDDWRISSNLTLNLGIAWALTTPITEADNRQANFNFATGQLLVAGHSPAIAGCPICVASGPRVGIQMDKTAFEPRIGIAWKPWGSQNTAVRAGYAIFHDSSWNQGAQGLWENPPYLAESDNFFFNPVVLKNGTNPGTPGSPCPYGNTTAANPVDCGLANAFLPAITIPQTPPKYPGTLQSQNLNFKLGRVQQFNINVERQLPGNIVLTAGYAGSRSSHILVDGMNLNVSAPTACAGGPNAVAGYTLGCGPGGAYFGNPYATPAQGFSFPPTILNTNDVGAAKYDSLQVKAETKSARHGIYALLGYTYAKTYDSGFSDGLGSNLGATYWPLPGTTKADWSLSQLNLNHQFTASVTYDLPFGRGKRFGSGWDGAMNSIVGNWEVDVIERILSGFPVFVVNSNNQSGVFFQQNASNQNRPDMTCNADGGPHKLTEWFNTSCFTPAAVGELGNAPRAPVSGPRFVNTDFSLIKHFPLPYEGMRIDFRAEFFNLFNHAQFGNPNPDINAGTQFGVINSTVGNPRVIQFALKFIF
jgi:Carboxypeptidase regulatory-like domain